MKEIIINRLPQAIAFAMTHNITVIARRHDKAISPNNRLPQAIAFAMTNNITRHCERGTSVAISPNNRLPQAIAFAMTHNIIVIARRQDKAISPNNRLSQAIAFAMTHNITRHCERGTSVAICSTK